MKKLLFRMLGIIILSIAPLLTVGVVRAAADTCTWSGAGVDDNWNTSANWTGCDNSTTPEAGDSLVFPMTVAAADRANINNFTAATSFNSIQFTGTNADCSSPSYVLPGNSITLTGDVVYSATGTCPVQISLDIIAGADIDFVNSSAELGSIFVISPPDGSGTLNIGSHSVGFIADDGNELVINSAISGTGLITFTGPGYITPYGPNFASYDGDIALLSGAYSFDADLFGSTVGATTVSSGASLTICSDDSVTIAEDLYIGGTAYGNFQKIMFSRYCGVGSGVGSAESNNVITLSGDISLLSDIDMSGSSRDAKLTGSIAGVGRTITLAEGFDFQLEVALSGANTSDVSTGIHKSGNKQTTYAGDQSATNPIAGYNNTLIVSAGSNLGDVIVEGGTLKGAGSIGVLTLNNGTVAPGLSPGCLTSGNLVYTGGTLQIEIHGATVCTEYDQQGVTGTVSLGTATTLDIDRLTSYIPALNAVYVIINNDGSDAVTGTFSGLAQGATTVVDGVTYTISYTGGDGNDVTLTVTGVATTVGAPNTGFTMQQASIALPIFAVLSGVTLLGMQKRAFRKK